jgi:hypothetical protein
MDELHTKGYLLLKDALKISEKEEAHSYIRGQLMDYASMKKFIENTMLEKINQSLDIDITYTKFRVSNNNNSVDAGGFHRDISMLQKDAPAVPIYTCLCYLDKTVMELVPETHTALTMSYMEAFSKFNNSIQLSLNPTDLLIFHSSLIHRGIFTENLGQRRLIQVFNCFLTKADFETYSPRLLDIEGDSKFSDFFIVLYKSYFTSFIPNLFGYLNSATGSGVTWSTNLPKCTDMDLEPYWYGSSEGLCPRVRIEPNTMQKTNQYYIAFENDTLPSSCGAEYKYLKFTRQFIIYFAVLFLMIGAIVAIIIAGIPLILTPTFKKTIKRLFASLNKNLLS